MEDLPEYILATLFGFVRKQLDRRIILLWNCIGLGLLLHVVITGILSAPLPFQTLAFDQPNVAVLYFPFNGLPACVVPLVLLSHLASIRLSLLIERTNATNIIKELWVSGE